MVKPPYIFLKLADGSEPQVKIFFETLPKGASYPENQNFIKNFYGVVFDS